MYSIFNKCWLDNSHSKNHRNRLNRSCWKTRLKNITITLINKFALPWLTDVNTLFSSVSNMSTDMKTSLQMRIHVPSNFISIISTVLLCRLWANCPGNEVLFTTHNYRKKEKTLSSPVFVLYKLLHQELSFGCRAVMVKRCTTKLDARAELLFSLLNLLPFLLHRGCLSSLITKWLLFIT